MTKKDNNIDKSYDFGKSEFNRKMKKIYQEMCIRDRYYASGQLDKQVAPRGSG